MVGEKWVVIVVAVSAMVMAVAIMAMVVGTMTLMEVIRNASLL